MRALVYSSKAQVDFTLDDLKQLAANAARRNAQTGVTGYLYFDKDRFMQYIEGEAEAIDELMTRLEHDPRHLIQRVVVDDDLAERRFPNWYMQWFKQGSLASIRLEHILYDFMLLKTPPTSSFDLLTPHV